MFRFPKIFVCLSLLFVAAVVLPGTLRAQSLALEGETGGFIVPAAYTVPSETGHSWARPTLGFHYVANGPVIGDFYISSITGGYKNWIEFGYTRNSHSNGRDTNLGKLWQYAGFDAFHGKVKIISENRNGHNWVPAVAVGGIIRINDQYVTGALAPPCNLTGSQRNTHCPQTNGDIYAVATKLVTKLKVPLLLDAGIRGTNAQLFGAGGNASSYVTPTTGPTGLPTPPNPDHDWAVRGFGGIGIPIPISRSPKAIIIQPGAEISQQPRYTQYTANTHLPSTESYGLRFTRLPTFRWTIDAGIGHIGNTLTPASGNLPAAQLHANSVKSLSMSYRF